LVKKKGMPIDEAKREAALILRDTYPTYSKVGKLGRKLRVNPLVGTFVAFPMEVVRTTFNNAMLIKEWVDDPVMRAEGLKRAVYLATAIGSIKALAAMSKEMFDVDDEDEEGIRNILGPFQRNTSLVYMGRNDEGQILYWDAGALSPHNYIYRMVQAGVTRGLLSDVRDLDDAMMDMTVEILDPYLGADIAFQAATELVVNRKMRGGLFGIQRGWGGEVYNPEAPVEDQLADMASHMFKAIAPGTLTQAYNVWRGSQDEALPYGRVYNLDEELAAFAGFRQGRVDPAVSLRFSALEAKTSLQKASSYFNQVALDPNEVSQEDLAEAAAETIENRRDIYEDLLKFIQFSERSGLSKQDVRSTLLIAGVAKKDVNKLLLGRIPEWKPNLSTIRKRIRNMRTVFRRNERVEDILQDRLSDITGLQY
jgi:hypothetical protein